MRFEGIVLRDADEVEPSASMTVAAAATLGGLRRGVQPIRIILIEQKAVRVSPEEWDAPMPMAF
jgi:hypothetical protein